MIAQVVSVVQGVTKVSTKGNDYTVTEFTYKPFYADKGFKDPVTRDLFTNLDFHGVVISLAAGDWVNLEFNQDKWSSLKSVETTAEPSGGQVKQTVDTNTGRPAGETAPRATYSDTSLSIARAVALKAAIELVANEATINRMPAKTKPEDIVEWQANQALLLAKKFEPYLTLQKDEDALELPTTDVPDPDGETPFKTDDS